MAEYTSRSHVLPEDGAWPEWVCEVSVEIAKRIENWRDDAGQQAQQEQDDQAYWDVLAGHVERAIGTAWVKHNAS